MSAGHRLDRRRSEGDATNTTRRTGQRDGRLLLATSALLFGVLGWLLAHAATDWLFAHTGHGPAGGTAHGHLHVSAAVVLVACLAGGSLLATFTVALLGRRRLSIGTARSRRAAASRSSLISTASFVAAEFAEHAVTGRHDVPPVGLLLLGCVIHALLGAGSSLLWRRCVGGVLQLARLVRGSAPAISDHRTLPARMPWVSALREWRALALAGRAPPVAPAIASL
jgi:hypothetical protein